MRKSKQYSTILLFSTVALSTIALIVHRARLRFSLKEALFRNPDDEKERRKVKKHQSVESRSTAMLSGFGQDRMNDDAAINTRLQMPKIRITSD